VVRSAVHGTAWPAGTAAGNPIRRRATQDVPGLHDPRPHHSAPEGHTVTKLPAPNDRESRLIISVAVGALVLALVVLFAALVAVDADADRDSTSRRCPGQVVGTVDPVSCLPYVGSGGAATTNHPGSSARRSAQQPRPKAPAAKVPAAPKAPAPKAPAAPPRISLKK
jgi:hypothetical protein